MQRIDENTYIDDTLVTCAEYQLFLDEMREQGKYFQPDHWASYQFPRGQGSEPVLGIRYSDAITFCDWLTSRANIDWKYRLPTIEETRKTSIRKININMPPAIGCWGINHTFAWLYGDALKLCELLKAREEDIQTFLTADFEDRLLDRMQSVINEIEFNLAKPDRLSPIAFIKYIKPSMAILRNTLLILSREPASLKLDKSHIFADTKIIRFNLDKTAKLILQYGDELGRSLGKASNLLYLLENIKGRITGEWPAFEGICLVKERIR